MSQGKVRNTDELRKILDAILKILDWQEQLVCEALNVLNAAGRDEGGRGASDSGCDPGAPR